MSPSVPKPAVMAATAAALAVVLAGAWYACRRGGRVDLAGYAPASALAFVEVDSVPALADGLARSDAWRRVGPALGLSNQLDYVGPVAEALGRFGIGPDEAGILGQAQIGVVVTGLEATAGAAESTEPQGAAAVAQGSGSPEAPPEAAGGAEPERAVVIKPHFALLIETHYREGAVRSATAERLPALARRVYGEQTTFDSSPYRDVEVTTAHAPGGARQIVWAVEGGLVVIGNGADSVRAVLDTIAGQTPALASDFYLAKVRPEVSADGAAVFAYFSEAGVGRLVGVGPGVIAGTITADPDRAATVSKLFGGVTERAVRALGYSGTFENGRFTDRYYTVLAPGLSEAVGRSVQSSKASPGALDFVPEGAAEVTYAHLDRPGDAASALLVALAGSVDAATAATITQIGIELRRSYGVEPGEAVSPALGDEVLFVDFGGGEPVADVFAVREQGALLPVVERYLRKGDAHISTETYKGVDILRSTNGDGRAAAFASDYLILGTRDQIARMLDAREAGASGAAPVRAALASAPNAALLSQRADAGQTGDLLLALSGALGASDGSQDRLATPEVHAALADLPPAVSVTELRGGALYVESRSAVGSLTYLTAFL